LISLCGQLATPPLLSAVLLLLIIAERREEFDLHFIEKLCRRAVPT